jgi:hypothetical protein
VKTICLVVAIKERPDGLRGMREDFDAQSLPADTRAQNEHRRRLA